MNGRDTQTLPLAQPLTPREEEILILIGDGKTNRQIAEHLTIALSTVKWYVRQIYNKLGVNSRAEAAARARGLGLLPSEESMIRHNLPAAATPFVGREQELESLAELIADPQARIITLVGPGGIGKTRLALETAGREAQSPSQFTDGIFFVSLAPLESADEIVAAIATALDFHFQGSGNETGQILSYLEQKKMLLVMDNFEHILEGRTSLAEISRQAAGIKLLVTSRERLQMRGEQLFPLGGLEMTDREDSAAESPAAQLFLHVSRRTVPDFQLLEGDAEQLQRICRLVEGMPLGLELAASWVGLLPLSAIAAEIEQNLNLLATEHHDVPRRHQSMQATIDISWRRLTSEQKRAFQELTVFRGGFTRAVALEVAGVALPLLVTLVNKSWLSYDRQKDRYYIHELLRQYGAVQLGRDSKMERSAYDRHSTVYCQALANHTDDLKGAGQQLALATIEADIANVRQAWNHALLHEDLQAMAISLEALFRFCWNNKWYSEEGRNTFEKAVTVLRTGEGTAERDVIVGRLLASLGWFYASIGQSEKASEMARESLDLLQRLGSREETLMPLLCLAMNQESLEESNRLLRESLALAREIGDQWAIGDALLRLGGNAQVAGHYEEAEQRWRGALKQFRKTGDTGGASWALAWLSVLAGDRGQYEEALALARETMSLAQESGFPSNGLYTLGKALYDLGAYEEAEEQFQQRLAHIKELGLRSWIYNNLFLLGKVAFRTGDYARAAQQYQESLAGALEFDDLDLVALNHDALGRLNMSQAAGAQAREHSQAALQVAIPLGHLPVLLASIATVAELFAEEGDLAYAALLATLITNHPASQARIKERAARLLTRLEVELPADDLEDIRRRGRQSDLDTMAARLLLDLKMP